MQTRVTDRCADSTDSYGSPVPGVCYVVEVSHDGRTWKVIIDMVDGDTMPRGIRVEGPRVGMATRAVIEDAAIAAVRATWRESKMPSRSITRDDMFADFPEQRDWVLVHIDGGYERGGVTVRVSVPIGHSVDEMLVEWCNGNGWDHVAEEGT